MDTDIEVVDAGVYLLPVTTRVPLKFRAEALTCGRVSLQAQEAAGRRAVGWGETPLNVQWAWAERAAGPGEAARPDVRPLPAVGGRLERWRVLRAPPGGGERVPGGAAAGPGRAGSIAAGSRRRACRASLRPRHDELPAWHLVGRTGPGRAGRPLPGPAPRLGAAHSVAAAADEAAIMACADAGACR